MNLSMPAEWEPHDATWMAWPTQGPSAADLDDHGLRTMREAWASVARAVATFEPVRMVIDPLDVPSAAELLGDVAEFIVAPLDDCWMRDMGPSFVHGVDGSLQAVSWIFNGWGQQSWASWEHDEKIADVVADAAGTPIVASPMVNEGGGFHVDGQGTVLVTETVQLGDGRNPTWTKAQVEAEFERTIGTTRTVWLPRGLTRDYEEFGTRGHVDIVAAFAGPHSLVFHEQQNPSHPDHIVSKMIEAILCEVPDTELCALPAPSVVTDDRGWVDYSYVNHYVVNGGVIVCSFDDPADDEAAEILEKCYPGRAVVQVDARAIFDRGGGIHCITQQQPRARA